MAFSPWGRTVFVALASASALTAQQRTEPAATFDVVSIHAVPPNAPPVVRDINFTPVLPGGQYIDSRAGLSFMIGFAYDVKNYSKLVGLPNWAKEQSFAVSAKAAQGLPVLPPPENSEQVRLMMRAMLADRFHLQLHTETRREPIFILDVAKGGIRIREVDPPVPPAKDGYVGLALGDDGGRLIGKKSTIAGLIRAMIPWLPRPVVDQTGLRGYYDFDVKWSALETPGGPRPNSGLGPEGIALLISTMQSQFGLRLVDSVGSVEYWVVDHVEPPTDN